ncbi:MAG: hypothetical protein JXX14_19785, partial [Deltaproteobacteria bacterium]|nr:hypothetical protein [Deltaproteobacteria bacterium]
MADSAARFGGASKPSGAGGGDAVVALFHRAADAKSFTSRILDAGLDVLDFDTHVPGLTREK